MDYDYAISAFNQTYQLIMGCLLLLLVVKIFHARLWRHPGVLLCSFIGAALLAAQMFWPDPVAGGLGVIVLLVFAVGFREDLFPNDEQD